MAVIPVAFKALADNYPHRPNLTPELKKLMLDLPGTPCCVQMSHALNMAGERIGSSYPGQRRKRIPSTMIKGERYYYLPAVDELEAWLTLKYGAGEPVHWDEDAKKRRGEREMKSYLQGRTGILVFREGYAGFHTELWDGRQIVQRDMDEHRVFSTPKVLFWDTADVPSWLVDFMNSIL